MPPEKPKKKKRPKEDSAIPSEKPKKKKRLKEDPAIPSEKPKKKKRLKENSTRPKKKRKKIPPKDSTKQNPMIKKGIYGLLIILVVVFGFRMIQQSNRDKATSKGYSLALSALDKMQLRCTVLWSEIGIDKACSQSLGEMAIGKLKKDVELKVIEARSHKFTAQARSKFKGSDKIFQVNKKGKLFLNVNGCLAEVSALNPTVEDIKRLEGTCKAPPK